MEKIAFISDIHSNCFALQAVLEDIEQQDIKQIINLGDSLYGAISPRQTFELLNQPHILHISGNQNRQIYQSTVQDVQRNTTLQFILNDLNQDAIDWLKKLSFDLRLQQEIYCCHATPKNDEIYLLEDVSSGLPKVRTEKEILKLLNGEQAKFIIHGHSHIHRTVQLSTGQYIINAGSVGYPAYFDNMPYYHQIENFSPMANYVVLEIFQNIWKIRHHQVSYDWQAAAKKAKQNGRDDWAYNLTTGRVKSDME
ncbi:MULTISPECIES: metallophosphoesterase family protein [unclassified Acinetobacter]|uniref:metallophosphoesterase family protein n=1 Tax=unclassified Acinetobacter TaxID=196816 RepID=UPI0035B940DF